MAEPLPIPVDPSPRKTVGLLAIVALFAYFNSLHGAFVLDDGLIANNPDIGRPFHGPLKTRPVVAVTIAANYWLDGTNSRGYHLINLLIHILAAACLWDLVRRVLVLPRFGDRFAHTAGWIALAAALVWLVHPLNTQAVTYTIQRCESLMGLFFLATLWCFLRGATSERPAGWYALATVCSALGAGSKEVMIALPPVLVLFDRAFLAGSWRGVLRRWRPLALISLPPLIGAALFAGLGYLTGIAPTVGFKVISFTPLTYALTQTEVILHYLRLSFWPDALCLDYLDWPVATFPQVWPALVTVGGLLTATAVGVMLNRAWGFAAAAFFLILAPTSSFIPVQDAAFEHRMYLSLAALVCLVVVLAAAALGACRRRWPAAAPILSRSAGVAVGLIVLALAFRTVVRNEDYGSQLSLYADNARKRPENSRVRAGYASLLFQMGKLDEAEQEILAALASPRQLPGNIAVLAGLLFETGRTAQALELCQKVYALTPDDPALNRQYILLLLVAGRAAEALPICRQTVDQLPNDATLRLQLALALQESGHADEGLVLLRELSRTKPEELTKTGQLARAIAQKPDAPADHVRLARLYARAWADATEEPTPEALDTLAMTQARLGDYAAAGDTVRQAIAAAERLGRDPYEVGLMRRRERLYAEGKPFLPSSFAPSPQREVTP